MELDLNEKSRVLASRNFEFGIAANHRIRGVMQKNSGYLIWTVCYAEKFWLITYLFGMLARQLWVLFNANLCLSRRFLPLLEVPQKVFFLLTIFLHSPIV